jgi:hypothetical protein
VRVLLASSRGIFAIKRSKRSLSFGEVLGLHLKLEDGAVLVIRTTGEHPFYRYNGQWRDWTDGEPGAWTAAFDLREGDAVLCHNGQWAVVQELHDTGDWERVYNLRVAEDHTEKAKPLSIAIGVLKRFGRMAPS